jgi:hypothetical protein
MKKIKIRLQQCFGGSYRVDSMTNAVKYSSFRLNQKPLVVNVGDAISAEDAQRLCEDGTIEVQVFAIRN